MNISGRVRGWVGTFIIACCVLLSSVMVSQAINDHTANLQISFLDVGQGDATLIETPDGIDVLIDGGKQGSVGSPLASARPFYDRSIDLVVATHADSDHIGGLSGLLGTYRANRVVVPTRFGQTAAATHFGKAVQAEHKSGAVVDTLAAGDVLRLGPQTYMLALFPPKSAVPEDSNKSSLVLKLIHGETSIILPGDVPESIETYLASRYGTLLDADILKVGHHGSDTSSSWPFLSAVSPAYAVISAGAYNSYGHPHDVVLDRLEVVNASTTCTCNQGTITFASDGEEFERIQ